MSWHPRLIRALTALALVAALAVPVESAGAEPVPTFYVRVDAATMGYGHPPLFDYSALYGGLPPGAEIQGKATCSQVYTSGIYGPTQSSYGPGNSGLPPGTYRFVSSSCSSDPAFPLTLANVGGSYHLVVSGGSYTVTRAGTAVGGAGTQGGLQDGVPTPTILNAVVLDSGSDDRQLEGKTVTFNVQGSNGVWIARACTTTTTRTTAGDYLASCVLDTFAARVAYLGTGVWTAQFAGDTLYNGSSFTGQISGLTTPDQAAKSLEQIANSGTSVRIEPRYVPPDCGNPYAGIQTGSIIEVSLSTLDCSQLQALQITTGVLLGIALAVGGGSSTVINIAEQIAYNASVRAVTSTLLQWQNLVTVTNPLYGL